MRRRVVRFAAFALATCGLYYLERIHAPGLRVTQDHGLWEFLAIVCGVVACQQAAAILVRVLVQWRKGPEGEIQMLTGFTRVVAGLALIATVIYSLGLLKAFGVVAAGFAGMLLGWSLQAPVSGVAAWALVTLKRPFRVGDRVMFPSLGLNGDVKQIGMMYTVLDQVGGAIGSEDAIGRDILIPNAMLFAHVAINYTPKAEAAFFLDEVVIRMTYDSDWDTAEQLMLQAAREVTGDIVRQTGQDPYIRSDIWDYGILMRLRYMTMAKDRPRITHELVKRIFKAVQHNPRVDMAIPFVYSFRKSTEGAMRGRLPGPEAAIKEIPVGAVDDDELPEHDSPEFMAEADQLVKNIRQNGLLQPIIVTPMDDGRYRILAGHKRFSACRTLGWKMVPVVIRPVEIP